VILKETTFSNICENNVSFMITFAQGFDDEPGSNVMPFSHHVLNFCPAMLVLESTRVSHS